MKAQAAIAADELLDQQQVIAEPEQQAHCATAEAVAQAFGVSPAYGLPQAEVRARRAHFGANELPSVKARSAWRILLDQFVSIIVALLGAAAAVALLTGDHMEVIAILVVLAINALVGFLTEWQAGRALDALRREAHTTSRVRREGRELMIDAAELVPGDVVLIGAGDRVPADLRLVEAVNLRAEESALTGESAPVEKTIAPVRASALLAERHSMLFLGTTIAAGRGAGIATATGTHTALGKIGRLVASAAKESTPLEKRLGELGRRLVLLVIAIAAIVFLAGWLRGDPLLLMLEVAISLAVAAVPEGLPAVTTLILALGVLRMARQRAIVRHLPAVETLGSTTVICTDKTGTLTENRMTTREFRLSDGRTIDISAANSNFEDDDSSTSKDDDLLWRAVRVGVLCNEASFNASATDGARTAGDPTEMALLDAAHKLDIDVGQLRARYPKLKEIPFDAATMRMTTAHGTAREDLRFVMLKGAPAVILDACSNYFDERMQLRTLDERAREQFLNVNREMADRALRVLGLAEKQLDRAGEIDEQELANGYTFIGFVGMIDPPRAGVAEAIRLAHAAGIRTVMLTGDQINTARAIARELGLSTTGEPRALHARDLEDADHARIAALADKTDVFARVSPEDKLHIVEALQAAHEIVAVTGDGVNDAPALKKADIGIAMGTRGTEAAKEAADVVLADDNFATLVKAVEGGRTIYANIIKFVHMMFSHNLGEVLTIFAAIIAGLPLPLLPLQILWINLVTDIFPALALAVEPAAPDVMQRAPRRPRAALLSRAFLLLIGWQGAMLAVLTLGAYIWALRLYGAGAHARTVALFALVAVQLGHFFNCRSRTQSVFTGFFRNPFIFLAFVIVVGLQLLAVYLTPLASVLDTVRLKAMDWAATGICFGAPIAIVELTKLYARRKALAASSPPA
jgi:Ca2+-transporting ATPase